MKFSPRYLLLTILIFQFTSNLNAGNPIIANRGVNDPHIKIFNDKAYLYATHDRSAESTKFADEKTSFAEGYASPTWPHGPLQGRHGSFFTWHNQWYYAYCDMSQTGNRRFRDTFISYIHYRSDGTIAPIRVDGVGVGEYRADQGRIEAEDYFNAALIEKVDVADHSFAIHPTQSGAYTVYPNIQGIREDKGVHINFCASLPKKNKVIVEVRQNSPEGKLIRTCAIKGKNKNGTSHEYRYYLNKLSNKEDLCFVFKEVEGQEFLLDGFEIFNK